MSLETGYENRKLAPFPVVAAILRAAMPPTTMNSISLDLDIQINSSIRCLGHGILSQQLKVTNTLKKLEM